ncbi:MAG: hypothetical protein IIB40_09690 [Candidatus Marinimicrobia bacterium]|nr:hypothetical protein [Candidatus Neomarinimicrobiota bacterium]
MNKVLKWVLISVGSFVLIAFLGFLWFIPPFTLLEPEAFSDPAQNAPPSLDHIEDPAQRLLAERGKYLVNSGYCIGCHVPLGDEGPNYDLYLAGGMEFSTRSGTYYSANLTPDPETGLGRYTDEEIKRALQNGVRSDGRLMDPGAMPWTLTSSWTEEDLHAAIVYLRNIKPVYHKIPDPLLVNTLDTMVPGD